MIDVADSNNVYYYHFDGLGSVAALSDSTGCIVEQYSYDVFGEPNRVSDVNNPYLFTGRRLDPETSNYYYRARYYEPSIGRFLQTDPIGYYGGLNLYTYCGNNAVNWLDPLGDTRTRIRDRRSCMTYCARRRQKHFDTARWLYNLALQLARDLLEDCHNLCNEKFPPGACPSDPLDSNAACHFLCDTGYSAAITAAYSLYLESIAGAWSQYGACNVGCRVFW